MLVHRTLTYRTRSSTIVLGLAAALLMAACGGDDSAAGEDSSTLPSTDVSTTTLEPTTTSTSTPTTTAEPATTTAAPSTTAPATTSAPITAAPALEYCDGAGPLPAGAVLDSSLTLDVKGDGTADDLVEAYDVDGWSRLRVTTGSVVSEIVNPAIDGRYRPLGVAPVFPGDSAELFVVTGEGSAASEVGVFGIDNADCLFSYTYTGTTDDFTMLIRPASPFRSGGFCFDGGIGLVTAEQRADGLWDASSSAFEIAAPQTVQYIGASDDYSEGLEESDLGPFGFDCFGLVL